MLGRSPKNINFQGFSEKEKAQLKKRIARSVFGDVRRKKYAKYGYGISAVVIIVLLTIRLINPSAPQVSSIESYANTIKDQKPGNKVQLLLSADHQVDISEGISAITYSKTGEHIDIGKEQSVSQKTLENDVAVFNTLIVPYGKRSEIILSDGSKVWLNSGSKLVFPAHFSADKREVYLEGEAIFEVAHDRRHPFFVKSEHHEIEVLGTVFNVSNYSDEAAIYTVLQSGKIQINSIDDDLFNGQSQLRITPGTLATFNKDNRSITTKKVDTAPYFAWRDGIFIFKNDALKSIMTKISRYYNVEIIIHNDKLANETFSGHLDVKENIEHVMQIIKDTETAAFDFQWTNRNQITIK